MTSQGFAGNGAKARLARAAALVPLAVAMLAASAALPMMVDAASAQAFTQSDAKSGAVMTVPVNKSQVLKLDRPFSKAMIGNPEIADVMPLSSNSVYVLGRATGSTNLALYDRGPTWTVPAERRANAVG